MKVNCDKCNKEFEIDLLIEKVEGDVRRAYFNCPNCNTKYISYYLNNRIEQRQLKMQKLMVNASRMYVNSEKYLKNIEKLKVLTEENRLEMKRLKDMFGE
ncbi:hypothetical protein K5V21_06140 [Clostridium sardiniense]|uniref:Transglycosylase n=1 Tax=Clostridium sardiniense TaxID=29369 RepID=A0ABS7KW45_CLOSR|nr:hypothetical protein [Clostridium sardiniense]MBY0755034.1 hypothetical protein [Clostridium sardiniense]MDQ0459111.1 DNA-directed RNA polymerase subunit RPC12/RpoP [Clostridium sardiniense]